MLDVRMTPNLLGFKVSGDYGSLDSLHNAIFALCIKDATEEDTRVYKDEEMASTRLLALSALMQDAFEGDKGINLVDNHLPTDGLLINGRRAAPSDVQYSFNVLYPEAMYEVMVLNYLVQMRRCQLQGRKRYATSVVDSEKSMLDSDSCTVRAYQALVLEALRSVVSAGVFARIRKLVNSNYHDICRMYEQWVDVLNHGFAYLERSQREQQLGVTMRDLAEYEKNDDYKAMKTDIDVTASRFHVSRDTVEMPGTSVKAQMIW